MTWFKKLNRRNKSGIENKNKVGGSQFTTDNLPQEASFGTELDGNMSLLKDVFKDCSDLIFREFIMAQRDQIKLALIYVDGLTNKSQVSEQIMRALSLELPVATENEEITKANAFHYVKMRGLCIHQIKESEKIWDAIDAILSGDTVLLVDGHATAIINGNREWESRGIEDSKTEVVIRGPREAFVETLLINTSMIRRKIKDPNLKIEMLKLGKRTKTDVALVYLKGIIKNELVKEAKKRLKKIEIDGVLESNYIEEYIVDTPRSPFSTVFNTDRPDRVAANLLEGRLAILVDGTPIVLTVPTFFIEIIQNPEDYYQNYQFSIAIRMLRIFTLFISLLVPPLYIAIIAYHQEMIPTPLLLSIAAQREAVPFPLFLEVLSMEIAFEILREAGLRLPRPAGQAVSIVGALIIGQAAVEAGLVAASTVIVVALTGIASFTVYYSGNLAIRLLRFPLMFLSAFLGLFGMISGVIFLVIHLASLRSFDMPYLSPLAPSRLSSLKDTAVRVPWWAMLNRPQQTSGANSRRIKPRQEP
ncbi:MAG: spore germination protein [Firmicutes bacterium]|nr:spore germination protein [Bacillota bacterium]